MTFVTTWPVIQGNVVIEGAHVRECCRDEEQIEEGQAAGSPWTWEVRAAVLIKKV